MSLENSVMLLDTPYGYFNTYITIAQFQYVESISAVSVLFMHI